MRKKKKSRITGAITLVVLASTLSLANIAQACSTNFGEVLVSTRLSNVDKVSSLSEPACSRYAVLVPSRLKVLSARPGFAAALHIGSSSFCYKDGQLVGYGSFRDCRNIVRTRSYYSSILLPGQVIELEVLDGEANLAVNLEGNKL